MITFVVNLIRTELSEEIGPDVDFGIEVLGLGPQIMSRQNP